MIRAKSILLACMVGLAAQPVSRPPLSTAVESFRITQLTPDHLELQLTLAMEAALQVTLDSAQFEGTRLNGIPVHIAPLHQKVEFKSAAEPRRVSLGPILIYYRDLRVLDPVRRMFAEQSAALVGTVRLHIDVAPAQRVIFGSSINVLTPLSQKVPVTLPGGPAARQTADAALVAAEATIQLSQQAVNGIKRRFGWTNELLDRYAQALLRIETHYRVKINGRTEDRIASGVGFRIHGNRFVTTAESIQPWRYNAELAQLLKSGAATLDDSAYDVRVFPGRQSLMKKQLQIVDAGSGSEKLFITVGPKLYSAEVGQRDVDSNLAVVEYLQAPSSGREIAPTGTSTREWERATFFRPRAGSPVNFEAINVRARRTGDRIELLDPADSAAFGSPLVVAEGLIGIVQSETSAAFIEHCCK